MTALAAPRRLTGRHVLLMLLAFFATVTAVNAVFIVLALDTFTGVSTDRAYQRGLDWNRELSAAAVQKARGWSASAEAQAADGAVWITARFKDAAGRPLDALVVRGELRRPTNAGSDASAEFEARGGGRYVAALPLTLRGNWDLRIEAEAPDGARHVLEQRLWLP